MSLTKSISIGMGIAIILLGLSMYLVDVEIVQVKEEENSKKEDIISQQDIDNSLSVQQIGAQILNSTTEYVIKEINYNTGEEIQREERLPEKFIGMSRSEFIDSITEYNSIASLSEIEKGLVNMCVLSFSPERVVVQASYKIEDYHHGYYLCVYDNMLIVYLADRETVYMETDIHIDELPKHYKVNIIEGLYIESEQVLFGLFENYTS